MKLNSLILMIALFLAVVPAVQAQSTDLMRLEYTYIPQSNPKNVFTRTRAFINFPIPLGWEGSYLIPGIEFRNVNIDTEGLFPFDEGPLNVFRTYRATISYTCKFKSGWRLGVKLGGELSSNFVRTDFLADDLRFSGALFMIKDKSGDEVPKPSRWVIGVQYSTNQGRPFPLPVVNYYREFRPGWSYSLGTPKTNLKRRFNKRHALQAFVSLDGFFANIQDDVNVVQNNSTTIANNISMTTVFGALGYEYFFSEQFLFYAYGGYTILNEIRLRDNNRGDVFTFNNQNTIYLRTGVKFKI